MSAIVAGMFAAASSVTGVVGVRQAVANGAAGPVTAPRPIAGTRAGRYLGLALTRAGIPIGPDAFTAGCVAATLAAGAAAWTLLRNPVASLLAMGGVSYGAWGLVRSAERRYLGRLAVQLPLVAQQLAGALGSGLSLRQAIDRAASDAPEPSASELRRTVSELALGARIDEALEGLVLRVRDPGVRIMVTAILVQRTVGGNLAAALTEISGRLEERSALQREARSATAQARMSAWLVAGLPLAGGVLVEIAAPGTLARTVGEGPGLVLLVAATAMEVVGVLLVRRLIRGEAEW